LKKFFIFLILFIILNISTVYLLLFTSVGNDIVSPIIEKKVNEQGIVNFKLKEFILTTDSIKFIANIDEVSNIEIDGDNATLADVRSNLDNA